MTLANKLKKIADSIDGRINDNDKMRRLSEKDQENPDTRNQKMKRLAAKLLIPFEIETRQNNDFDPQKLELSIEKQKTRLEIEQHNQSESYNWPTHAVLRQADEIAEQLADETRENPASSEPGESPGQPIPNEDGEADKPSSSNNPIHGKDELGKHL